MDLVSAIGAAITSVRTAMGLLKGAAEVQKQVDVATINMNLAEVITQLTDTMLEANRLKLENESLKKELAKKESLADYKFVDGVYVKDGVDLAFCPTCYHNGETRAMSNNIEDVARLSGFKYSCTKCKGYFGKT